jgi:hypothetical protein
LPYYFNILDEIVETQGRNSIISLFTLKGTYFCTLSTIFNIFFVSEASSGEKKILDRSKGVLCVK